MKKSTFFLVFALSFTIASARADNTESQLSLDPLKSLELRSADFIAKAETCEEVLTNQVAIIDQSEKFILSLVSKKKMDITAYEITMLQKILTNRYLHLIKAVRMYRDSETQPSCAPRVLGNAIAIYDFTELGSRALKDSKLRRIILNFTNFPKYKLTRLKELYDHYTSPAVIQELQERIIEEKISLPSSLIIDDATRGGGNFYELSDVAVSGTSNLVSGATRVWGFISDQLKWRKGRLNKNSEALEVVRANLKPLDLIFETRNFTLSNYTIPGHWGHVAVWLGSKEELQELGVWDKEYFAPFRKFVEDGKNIIEVRKQGLGAVALSDYMNLDEVAVTRVSNALANAEAIMQELTEQIDKKYDFTFNAHSSDKLTCSEFIAFSYGDIHWPETSALFQVSIKPDDLAILTLYENSPTEFVLYLKGNKDGSFENKNFEEWKNLFGNRIETKLSYQ